VRRRIAVQHARDQGLSERHACRLVGQWRTTQRYQPTQCADEDRLTQSILTLASKYGRFGYRRITALLKGAGWKVGKDRVQRIWRREGLKVPARQKPRGRLWLNDGSCIRLRPTHRNHVWSYDFVDARTHDGRSLRLLVFIDEYTRECLAIRVARRLNSAHVIELLGDCMLEHGVPEHVRSDNVLNASHFLKKEHTVHDDRVIAARWSSWDVPDSSGSSRWKGTPPNIMNTRSGPERAVFTALETAWVPVEGPIIIYEVEDASTARVSGIDPLGIRCSKKRWYSDPCLTRA
jgi:hypothetical protein